MAKNPAKPSTNPARKTAPKPPAGEDSLCALLKPWLESFEEDRKSSELYGGLIRLFEINGLLQFSIDPRQVAPMLAYLLEELPKAPEGTEQQKQAAACFAATITQAWRAGSLFPSQAEDYAEWFKLRLPASTIKPSQTPPRELEAELNSRRPPKRIPSPPSDEDIALCAKILLSGGPNGDRTKCGFIPWVTKDYLAIDIAEDDARNHGQGAFRNKGNRFFKSRVKVSEYEELLKNSSFDSEWAAIKQRFPEETRGRSLFERTAMQERSLKSSAIAKFDTEGHRFQAILDLLCWKYCLWGVENDRPLLMEPSIHLTPYGTQIFIPAYMSLDATRDLDLGYITALHRARGVPRQGAKMSQGRQSAKDECVEAAQADSEARTEGLQGEARFAFIKKALNKHPCTDDAEISRMIKRGRTCLESQSKLRKS